MEELITKFIIKEIERGNYLVKADTGTVKFESNFVSTNFKTYDSVDEAEEFIKKLFLNYGGIFVVEKIYIGIKK